MEKNHRKEILFYYESRQNPNGDPGFENQPRLMSDGTIMVTDVRIKRTIRDYVAQNYKDQIIFVDYDKDGNPTKADDKAREIIGDPLPSNALELLLEKTFDVSLFGAFVPIRTETRRKGEEVLGSWLKLTGPLQFGIGRSVNKVNIINPMIVGRFVGKERGEKTEHQFSTFGRFYSVEYALIKIHGAINPTNLGPYYEHENIKKRFKESVENLPFYLWNGTDQLITRSKFPQRSILYIEIEYDSVIYNDLPLLIKEKDAKGKITSLPESPFIFDDFIQVVESRKEKIKNVKFLYSDDNEIKKNIKDLISRLNEMNIMVTDLPQAKQQQR
jgi:CRISPR-associated protein Csh2